MGKELAAAYPEAKAIFEQADELLGFSLSQLCWEGPEAQLNDTANTQPALMVHSMAALRVFEKYHPDFVPAMVAGHSLGELSACVAAGAMDFPTALRLVRRRGELMKRAGLQNPGSMAAILGLDIETLDKICFQSSIVGKEVVQVANDNSPGQVVISGHTPAVQRAMEAAKAAGAKRAVRLEVSIAAHSPLMASAQADFRKAVNEALIENPTTPLVGNVGADVLETADQVRGDLYGQLTARVHWTDTIRDMRKAGVQTFIEIGTGSVLTGLLKRIDADAVGLHLGEPGDFATVDS